MLCQYKDSLGVPGEGVHEDRIAGFALWDIVGTVIGAYLVAKAFDYTFWKTFGVLMLVAIFLHWIFCVETTLNKKLGLV